MVATAGRGRLIVALVCGAVLTLTGCESSTDSATPTETSESPSLAANVPAGFDPCTDIPQSVLDSEGLEQKIPDSSDLSSGVKRQGCMWVQTDGYAASIVTTNVTLDMVRGKNFPEATEFTIGSRRALSTRQLEAHAEESCYVNVEMTGGSLEFGLTNSSSNRKTGHLNTCDLARTLAEKVAPTIPVGA
ncbi:DUF3558 domain-containing protein [Nocardia testacea]|uniref:DUF3558 domain-containing protein n=1 Tax=Nocardia testacea TaxID=248551 RepID=A0ABW7VZB3_9NOCA|nr:DUF3558 domain-containing protein [Nocardia testacea]